MNKFKKQAATSAKETALNNNLQNKYYRCQRNLSNLKSQIGTLLFALQIPLEHGEESKLWARFELMLKEYVGLRNPGGVR